MKTIDILGSCVTRDTFKFPNNGKYKLGNYFARSSIISLYSNPIALKLNDIQLASAFQKRMVYYDLTKAFPRYLKTATSDYLVIDFIDERIRVLKARDTYITRSKEFVSAGLNIRGTIVSEEERLLLWKQKAQNLINDIKGRFNPENVILHKAYWQTEYKGKDGKVYTFEDPEIEKNNKLLNEYYNYIESNLIGLKIIKLDQYISDEAHIWGLSPFHYEEDYYIQFNKVLGEIVKEG